MTVNNKRKPHPIVERALEFAREGFEPVEFDEYAVEQLQEILKQSFGKPDLIDAVVDLINLAGILKDEEKSPKAAIQLMRVVTIAAEALKELKKISN